MKRRYVIVILALAVAQTWALLAAARWEARRVPLPERLYEPDSRIVDFADGSPMCAFLSPHPDDKWRFPVTLEEVDPDYLRALLAYEDKRFFDHHGVDPIAVARAVVRNLLRGRVVSGASTITMQTVRVLEPRPRTMRSKVIEAFRAVQLEMVMSKPEILETYLQYAPFGGNLEGVEAASLAFFGHRAGHLSPFEISYLLSVPQNPNQRDPNLKNQRRIAWAVDHVARRLYKKGVFTREQYEQARHGDAPTSVRPFPRNNLHVAQYLISRYGGTRVRSTIEPEAQSVLDHALAAYRAEFAAMNIYNASAVVVDNRTGAVVAAAGNFDFNDDAHQGQVIGFIAPRSPGSAMKPFIYALALDRGLALPDQLTADIPVDYGGYRPVNYDRRFHGLVRLEDSLAQSLNIPFINLVSQIGLPEYLTFLRDGGISTLEEEPGFYGLSIAVGGIDVDLLELTGLYAMVGTGGEYRDLAWTGDRTDAAPRRLLSPGAAYLTRRALRLRDRPDFPTRSAVAQNASAIFWKTGTSAHHRDAWALGGTTRYTAGVWVGNFDGAPARDLVGQHRAGPILFDVLDALSRRGDGEGADLPPDDLIKVEICAWSGYLAGPHCPHRKTVLAIRDSLPPEHCPFHQAHDIDLATGMRVNPLCRSGREVETKVFTVVPASYRKWAADRELAAPPLPPLLDECPRAAAEHGLSVISPRHRTTLFIIPGLPADRQEIPLEARADADAARLYWFVDGKLRAVTAPDERAWLLPEPGEHEVRVTDEAGRVDVITFRVVDPG